MRMLVALLAVLALTGTAIAQSLSGSYVLRAPNGTVLTLILQDNQGRVTGTITSTTGATLKLEGQSSGSEAEGTITDAQGTARFYLVLEAERLSLSVTELGANGQPDESTTQDLDFTRQASVTTARPPAPTSPAPSNVPSTTQPSSNAFTGRFLGQDVALELSPARNGGYQGSILYQGKTYPVTAQVAGGRLQGTFRVGSSTYLFAATPNGNALSLQLNGRSYALARQAANSSTATVSSPKTTTPPLPAPSPSATAVTTRETRTLEVQVGGQYQAGTRVNSSMHGASFVVPQAWIAAARADAPALVMGSNSRAGVGLVLATVGASAQDIGSYFSQPQDMGNNVTLQPTGPASLRGSRITVNYTSAQYAGQALGVIGPNGNAVVFFIAGPQDQAAYYAGLLEGMAGSLKFSPPKASAILGQYTNAIRGKKLYSFKYSGSSSTNNSFGSSSERSWWLCSDGSYAYSGNAESGGNFNTGGSTPQDLGGVASQSSRGDTGRWRVLILGSNVVLLLQAQNGGVSTYALSNNGKSITLNGAEVTINANDRCR